MDGQRQKTIDVGCAHGLPGDDIIAPLLICIYTGSTSLGFPPIAYMSLSSLTGALKLLIARTKLVSVDMSHVSLKAITQASLYSCRWFVFACN